MREQVKLAMLFLVIAVALNVSGKPANAITWGWVDEDGLYPNVGTIMVLWENGNYYQMCSGTLIDSQVFLTAGHCVSGLQWYLSVGLVTDVKVSFAIDGTDAAEYLAVEEAILHPDYWSVPPSMRHWPDVGALILTEPVEGITPAVVATEGLLAELKASHHLNSKTKILTVGYGSILDWPPPTVLYPPPLRRYAFSEFRALPKSWLIVSQNQAGGDGGTGYGDSGGPAFWIDPVDGSLVLVGTTSTGDPNLVATTFFHRADIARTLDFIDAVIGSLD